MSQLMKLDIFLGLGHNLNDPNVTMYYSASMGETKKRTLEQDDINGVLNIYRIIYVPKDEPTIHQACSYAVNGQTILVSPGTYTETLPVTVPAGSKLLLENYGVTVNINSTLTVNGELQMNYATLNGQTTIVRGILRADCCELNCSTLAILTSGELYAYNTTIKCSALALNGYMWGRWLKLNCSGVANIYGNGCLEIKDEYSNFNFLSGLTVAGQIISKGQDNSLSGRTKFYTLGGIGLVISGGYVQCEYTDFYTSSPHNSITINGGAGSFLLCQIISNGNYGVSVNSGTLAMAYTKVVSNPSGCGLNFMNSSLGFIYQNNIFDESDYNIKGDASSHFNAGNGETGGRNSFRTTRAGTYHIYSTYSGTITAWYNYWAGGARVFTSRVDASYPEQFDPNRWLNQGDNHETEEAEIGSGILLKKSVIKDDKPIEKVPGIEELDEATKLLYSKKYDEALVEMRRLVDKYRDGFVGKRALVFIENILAQTDRDKEILPMLEQYSNGKSKVAQFAHYRKVYQYFNFRLQEYDKAIEIMKTTEFSEEDTDMRQTRLYDLGVAYHDLLGKKAEAYRYFDELVKTYPDCPLAEVANTVYRMTKDGYEKPPEGEDEEVVTFTETKLFVNYPNPFNPSTVIKYQLADVAQISLKVYDVMGREVATLVNTYQNKGSYEVTFNANGLASGIYFYKLNAGGKQFINKMLLMK